MAADNGLRLEIEKLEKSLDAELAPEVRQDIQARLQEKRIEYREVTLPKKKNPIVEFLSTNFLHLVVGISMVWGIEKYVIPKVEGEFNKHTVWVIETAMICLVLAGSAHVMITLAKKESLESGHAAHEGNFGMIGEIFLTLALTLILIAFSVFLFTIGHTYLPG